LPELLRVQAAEASSERVTVCLNSKPYARESVRHRDGVGDGMGRQGERQGTMYVAWDEISR